MLLENFYKIIHIKEREDGKQEIEIELNPGHVLYQGHFPGQPRHKDEKRLQPER